MSDENMDDNITAVKANSHSGAPGNSSSSIESLLFHATMQELELMLKKCQINIVQEKTCKDLLQSAFDADLFHAEPKMTNSEIFAGILYMTVIDSRVPYEVSGSSASSDITVTQILSAVNININDLFRALVAIGEKIPLSEAAQLHFSNMKRKYCVISAIFHTFQSRLCAAVFREDSKERGQEDSLLPPIPETEGLAYRKKLAWVLFLLAKNNLLADSIELFEHFQLLLCCMEYILRNTPSFLLNTPYDSIRFGYYNSESGNQTILGRLASDFEVDLEDTRALHDNSTEPFFQRLLNRDGELDCDRLCEEYLKMYKQEGDLNELLFLSKNSLLIPLQNTRPPSHPSNGHTTAPPAQVMTPVRVAVNAVQQLNAKLAKAHEEPGSRLASFYRKCEPNPSESIMELMADLKERFLTRYQSVSGLGRRSTVGVQRWSLGVKLYQKVLETMIITESERLPMTSLSMLLSKEEFHKSMLACSMEVVLATYGQSWSQSPGSLMSENTSCMFPWILDVLALQVYDFYKVVESFIKAETNLSTEVVKHLQNVEFQILDSLAWKEGSSLFDALGRCDPITMPSPLLTSPVKMSMSGLTPSHAHHLNGAKSSVELFLSPKRPSSSIVPPSLSSATPFPVPLLSQQEVPPAIAEGSRPPAAPKSQSLTHFLNRVSRLGFHRLTKLCGCLNVSKDVEHKIWTCFEYCITKMPTLLKSRHLDQILMCCIYGICKVVEHPLLFKTVVNHYKTLPHARQEIYKNVHIVAEESDSIIGFYNRVFIQSVERYIKQFSNANKAPPLSPKPKQAISSPTYSLPGKKNFYVSPMKQSPFKAPASPSQLTPSTRILYSFGESIGTSDTFNMINEKMSAAKKRKMSVNKCLNFDS